jgi:methionine synthase II (cobalamin-independent)
LIAILSCPITASLDQQTCIWGIHTRRANGLSQHASEGGYDRVSTKLFQQINADTYYLEYDTERSGGFEPLAQLPVNKSVVLGVITSKFPEMEEMNALKERVFQAAEYVATGAGNDQSRKEALRRIGISPQCGFAAII